MSYPIIVVPFLNVGGMALFPFILVSETAALKDKVLLNHECIHLRQQAELLVIPFYILYLLNYIVNLVVYRQHDRAYENIVFEREAYRMEADLNYLNNRKLNNWARFFDQ